MRLRRALLASLPVLALTSACETDVTGPDRAPVDKVRFDHTVDPGRTVVAANNYVVTLTSGEFSSTYKGASALFGAGLSYGTSGTSVFNHNTRTGESDFVASGIPAYVAAGSSPGDLYASMVLLEDPQEHLGTKIPLGLITVQEVFAAASAPDDDFAIIRYSVSNPTGTAVTGLSLGLIMDPDLGHNSTDDVAEYDAASQLAMVRDGEGRFHGATVLSAPVASYRPFVNAGFAGPYFHDPSTNEGWYELISGGIDAAPVGPTDIRQFIGAGNLTIPAGATVAVDFAVMGGDDPADLLANAAAARARHAVLAAAPVRAHGTPVEIRPGTVLYAATIGFETAETAALFQPAMSTCGGAPIASWQQTGSVVEVTFEALRMDAGLRTGDRVFCTGRLSTGSYFAGFDRPTVDTEVVTVTRLTFHAATDAGPAWSPDGSRIAFASFRDGGGIYVMEASGGEASAVRLTNGTDLFASWSPDGARIAFARAGGIFTVEVATGAVTQLTATAFESGTGRADQDPVYSPDGAAIAFRRTDGSVPGIHVYIMESGGELSGAPARPVATAGRVDAYPFWSPDGSALYFTSIDRHQPGEQIMRLDPAVGEPATAVTQVEPGLFRYGALDPRGRTLAFAAGSSLILQELSSGFHAAALLEPRVNLNTHPSFQNLDFSPDGLSILFVGADRELYRGDLPTPMTPTERVTELTGSVQALVDAGLLRSMDGQQLIQKLADVQARLDAGQLNAATNNVHAFINKVGALVNSRRLTVITGEQLTADGNALILQISTL